MLVDIILCFYNFGSRSIVDALITLFQLFTMDHWYSVYLDSVSTTDYFFAALFIILWILLGSLVFRNVFVGIMGKYNCVFYIMYKYYFDNLVKCQSVSLMSAAKL